MHHLFLINSSTQFYMIKILTLIFFFSFNIAIAQTLSEERKVQQVLVMFFDALSENDLAGMQKYMTPDIRILEHGVIWNMDTVVALASKPRPANFKRINTINFFQTEVRNEFAFVSYNNKADISSANGERKVTWLESAVLVKEGGEWKVKMLHSTRISGK
jgi:ketosteroid isomerase-like protein